MVCYPPKILRSTLPVFHSNLTAPLVAKLCGGAQGQFAFVISGGHVPISKSSARNVSGHQNGITQWKRKQANGRNGQSVRTFFVQMGKGRHLDELPSLDVQPPGHFSELCPGADKEAVSGGRTSQIGALFARTIDLMDAKTYRGEMKWLSN